MFAMYLFVLCTIVFSPIETNSAGIFRFIHITGLTERFLNLFLLVPLAVFARVYFRQQSLRTIFVICLATSVSIELVQLLIPGRVSDPIDVIMNSAGALCVLIGIEHLVRLSQTHSL